MKVLGISAFYHDSAAALVDDGRIVAAAQEERFTRRRHDASFPRNSIRFCLDYGKVDATTLDAVVFYEKPFLKFERLLETYVALAPRGLASFAKAMPVWMNEKLFLRGVIADEMTAIVPGVEWSKRLLFSEHHYSHAASAFYPSPFDEAAILTIDGVGEWATTSLAHGRGNSIETLREIHFPHSLGLLYSAFTYYLGFRVNSGEYKVMGLAPYGKPSFTRKILDNLIDLKADGSFRLDLRYFDYATGLRMTNRAFDDLFGGPPRAASETLTERHMDIAASIQAVLDEAIVRMGKDIAATTGSANLCLAGGVALNCVSNARLLRSGAFRNIWIQPAAGDAGGAVGAALATYHLKEQAAPSRPPVDQMHGSFLGPEFTETETQDTLRREGAVFTTLSPDALIENCVDALVNQQAVGWFQGRMEFGPRALGARSILADPRDPQMQSRLNLKVKFRESFRPFAPAVLRESLSEWFDLYIDSPYMLLVADVADNHRVRPYSDEQAKGLDRLREPRSDIPATTHVDNTARLQTVHAETNPRFHELISAFAARTGCPVLVNTSFNVRGEPIVCTPSDAFRCFMGTDLDSLAIGNCFLRKKDQDRALAATYHRSFAPD
ncbi:MAG TPA: carbamoyltransferase [Gemmatimonadaceae bacterium]|nr:carbamoyltransferase [Gemmatimonadaceae bacterium]